MSSIRPLVTITVLAIVGAFLYAKINETEPPLPEGVEDWAVGTDIEVDFGDTESLMAPTFESASPGGPASAYSADAASAPAFDAGDAASQAPAWTPPPAPEAPTAEVSAAPAFDSTTSEVANPDPLAVPDLPPLPEMPPEVSSAAADSGSDITAASESQATTAEETLNSPVMEAPETTSAEAVSGSETQAQSSLFAATRLAVQAALDRGELSQALLLLSDWYGDPSLSPDETAEVNTLLSQLAGSVIYSTEPRLEPPYMVQPGERLETIAEQYGVPWQLLAKINGITSADQLQAGQEIKVLRGPFSAVIDISRRTLTLMLDRRYAGKFALDIDPSVIVEEGHWEVKQKLLSPADVSLPGTGPTTPTEERSLMLSSSDGGVEKVAVLKGTTSRSPLAEPAGRIMRLKPADAEDIFDILSKGSKVVIRR